MMKNQTCEECGIEFEAAPETFCEKCWEQYQELNNVSIEKLRTELVEYKEREAEHYDAFGKMSAENQKLRGALETISDPMFMESEAGKFASETLEEVEELDE